MSQFIRSPSRNEFRLLISLSLILRNSQAYRLRRSICFDRTREEIRNPLYPVPRFFPLSFVSRRSFLRRLARFQLAPLQRRRSAERSSRRRERSRAITHCPCMIEKSIVDKERERERNRAVDMRATRSLKESIPTGRQTDRILSAQCRYRYYPRIYRCP